jgi:anti-sigma regulatory factor (Ser/Thr protein kinase)
MMATAADSRTVSLTMPAKPEYVVLARLALSAVCRLTPLAPDEVADLKLAITEAAGLLVGAAPPEPAQLSFDYRLEDSRLVLCIEGSPEPAEQAEDLDERELGREILRATADEVEYGDGSVLLVKYLRSPGE